jgi:hypothetical protein
MQAAISLQVVQKAKKCYHNTDPWQLFLALAHYTEDGNVESASDHF